MSIWKKIIQAIKNSPVTKGVSINKISNIAGKTKNISNDFLKLIKTKDWKGFGRGQGAKMFTDKLKKGSRIFGKKIADNAKQIFNQKIAPDKKQILQTFDKATQSAKNNIKISKQTMNKFNQLNPRIKGLKVYQSIKQKVNNVKQQANKFPNFFKNIGSSTLNALNKAAYNFKMGSKSYYRGLLKFLAAGLFIYGIAISIPRQVRKYFIKKQQIQFQKEKLNHHQRMYGTAETKANPKKTNKKKQKIQPDYPSKQQVLGRDNSSSYNQAFDYRKIRERDMAKKQNYEY